MDGTLKVEDATTGKKIGPQTKKWKVQSDDIELTIDQFEEKNIDRVEFIVLPCDTLIKKEWKGIYLGFSSYRAPNHG